MKHLSSALIALLSLACSSTPEVAGSAPVPPQEPQVTFQHQPDLPPGVCGDCCGEHEGFLCASMEEGEFGVPTPEEVSSERRVHVRGKRYHTADCRRVHGERPSVAVSELPAGTKPCLFCKPHRQ